MNAIFDVTMLTLQQLVQLMIIYSRLPLIFLTIDNIALRQIVYILVFVIC